MLSRSLNFHQLGDVGHVTVVSRSPHMQLHIPPPHPHPPHTHSTSVERVDGLTKTADVFAIAEVGNSQARTHTIYKTTSPQWNKAFHLSAPHPLYNLQSLPCVVQ